MLSVQEEKALVLRISKLQRLKSDETALQEARRKRSGMDLQLHRKLLEERKHLRHDLQSEIQDIINVRVDSFPQPADEPENWSPEWLEKYIIRPQMALGSFDDETILSSLGAAQRVSSFQSSEAAEAAAAAGAAGASTKGRGWEGQSKEPGKTGKTGKKGTQA